MRRWQNTLPDKWRATVRRHVRSRLNWTDDPKVLALRHRRRSHGEFLERQIRGPFDAVLYVEARPKMLEEAERILDDRLAEEAALHLVKACLDARHGAAAAEGGTTERRTGMALASLGLEIAFIAELLALRGPRRQPRDRETERRKMAEALPRITRRFPHLLRLDPNPPGEEEAKVIAEGLRLFMKNDPDVLIQDPQIVQAAIDFCDPPEDYPYRTWIPKRSGTAGALRPWERHGRPGRPEVSGKAVAQRLSEANVALCGKRVNEATAALLCASSLEDLWWRQHPTTDRIRDMYRPARRRERKDRSPIA